MKFDALTRLTMTCDLCEEDDVDCVFGVRYAPAKGIGA